MKNKYLYGTLPLTALLIYFSWRMVSKITTSDLDHTFRMDVPLDFSIYLLGGERVAHHDNLYEGVIIDPWPFTYPPFAGWFFSLWEGISFQSATMIWHAISAACLVAVILLVSSSLGNATTPLTVAAACAFSFALLAVDPIHGTFFFGQINIVLMLLVCLDFLPGKCRLPGIGVGLAAGLKLTPALFGVLFLIQRRWWAAAGSFATFLATVVVGLVTVEDAKLYWTDKVLDSSRIGDHGHPAAQSIKSILIREFDNDSTVTWALLALAVVAIACIGCWFLVRVRQDALAVAVMGLAACLISPFSWFHHWVWIAMVLAVIVFGGMRWQQDALSTLTGGVGFARWTIPVWGQFTAAIPLVLCIWIGHFYVTAPLAGQSPTYSVFIPDMQEPHAWLFTLYGFFIMLACCLTGVVIWSLRWTGALVMDRDNEGKQETSEEMGHGLNDESGTAELTEL